MSIQITFEPTRSDYSATINTFSATLTRTGLYLVVLVLMSLALGSQGVMAPGLRTRSDWLTPFCLPVVAPLLGIALVWLGPLWQARRIHGQVAASDQMCTPITWTVDDAHAITQTAFAESTLAWAVFRQVVEVDDYYLLVHTANRRVFHFIPKRAFIEPETEQQFRTLVERRLGPIKDERRLKRLIVPLADGAVVAFLFLMTAVFWAIMAWRRFG